ncbi:hypothetical protein FRC11_014887 [Ceratobasidium sp. 423]|nr:hypothetical protein FRC11_014887 [Ceratobasidium sp. 423]
MSQAYTYSDNYTQPQYYDNSGSYDSAQTMQPPIQHMQPQISAYGYPSEHYNNASFTPSAQPVDNSSVLAQTYTYPNTNYNYANTPADGFSPYGPTPNQMVPHYPDPANQVPHQASGVPQYGDGQSWVGPARYAQVPTVHPGDLHDQRRGSCASMNTVGSWYSYDDANGAYSQSAEQNQYTNYDHQPQQQPDPQMSFGMYSPTQYARTQELARAAPYEPPSQWVSGTEVSNGNLEAPYGTLPIHEPQVDYERRSCDAYQVFDNGSVAHHQLAYGSPSAQSHAPTESPSLPNTSPPEQHSTSDLADDEDKDLFGQQRRAASYQQGLQLKYQRSGQLEQFEASHRRQDSFTLNQDYHTVAHDAPHHHNHPAHHQRHGSSSDQHSRLATAPIVPSQARERVSPCVQPSPEVEEKKETPSKKPALACLFCRKRKIACGPPPPDSVDRTCNQCLRRKQPCEYPTESRRGIRKTKEPTLEEHDMHQFLQGETSPHEVAGPIRRGRRSSKAHI